MDLLPLSALLILLVLGCPIIAAMIGAWWLGWSARRREQREADRRSEVRNVHLLMVDLAALSKAQRIEGWKQRGKPSRKEVH